MNGIVDRHLTGKSSTEHFSVWPLQQAIWLVLIFFISTAAAVADAEAEFWLCSCYVLKTDLGEKAGGWPVVVKLTEQGAASFTKFSEANLGKMIRIVINGRQFARFTLRVQGVGTVQAEFDSRSEAEAWQQTLLEELPETPCDAHEDSNA